MNNKTENNQNEKSKILSILSLIIGASLFGAVTFHYFQAQSLKPMVKKIALSSINIENIFDISKSYEDEKGISKNYLAKTISYLDYLPNDSKRTALLLVIGQTQIFAMKNTDKIAENYLLEQVIRSDNEYGEKMRELDIHISNEKGEFNKDVFDTYFNHLVKQYLSLKPVISIQDGNFYQNKFIESMKISEDLLDDKLERALYVLRMTIDNRDNLKEIFRNELNIVDFASDPQKTWKNSGLTEKFGKDVPDYLIAYLSKNEIDNKVISDFIKKYK